MPALTIANVLGFIPTNIWRSLKKFVTKDTLIVFDIPFKLSTKYTPAILIVMMCLSFANQFVRNIEIDCAYGGSLVAGGQGGRGGSYGNQQGGATDTDLNDYCWNHDTFLVAKALKPSMRGMVTYPGVSGYDRGTDTLIRQRYYKQVWLGVGKIAVLAFLPFFLWKLRGSEKMKGLIDVQETDENTEDEVRVSYFLETLGFNGGFAVYYLVCKLLAAITPLLTWMYLVGFMGQMYKYYGWNVMSYFMIDSDSWPNPMDALFPKMAKCEWARYGFSGDIELKSAQCQLPMNNLTQWSFFVWWWWTLVVFVVNAVSTLRLLCLWLCPMYRTYQYRQFVNRACKQDVEKARTYTVHTINGQYFTRRYKKSDIVNVELTFGDWLILSFLKRNLADWQFREFIKKLVVTENTALQLRPMPSIVTDDGDIRDDNSSIGKGKKLKKGGLILNVDDVDRPKGNNPLTSTPMGFINPYLQSPPTYSACETHEDDDSPSTPQNGSEEDDFNSSIGNTSITQLCNQRTIAITPPVKVNRQQKPTPTPTHQYKPQVQAQQHQLPQGYQHGQAGSSKMRR